MYILVPAHQLPSIALNSPNSLSGAFDYLPFPLPRCWCIWLLFTDQISAPISPAWRRPFWMPCPQVPCCQSLPIILLYSGFLKALNTTWNYLVYLCDCNCQSLSSPQNPREEGAGLLSVVATVPGTLWSVNKYLMDEWIGKVRIPWDVPKCLSTWRVPGNLRMPLTVLFLLLSFLFCCKSDLLDKIRLMTLQWETLETLIFQKSYFLFSGWHGQDPSNSPQTFQKWRVGEILRVGESMGPWLCPN